jgi:hypothetical protein
MPDIVDMKVERCGAVQMSAGGSSMAQAQWPAK